MRVLQILEASGGGAARNTLDLCEGFLRRGLEVHLVYSPLRLDDFTRKRIGELEDRGLKCYSLHMRREPHPSDLRAWFSLFRYLRENGPFDIVHGQSAKGGALARLLRVSAAVKVIYSPHGFAGFYPGQSVIRSSIYNLAERLLVRHTDKVVILSKWQWEEAARLGFPKDKIVFIPNGIEASIEKQKKPLGNKLIIGFVGRMDRPKSPITLFRAFERIVKNYPNVDLVMVGEGSQLPSLKAAAMELGLESRVSFPGYFSGALAMEGFDIFALPSEYEGFPYVLLEAMAAGLPIVVTEVGGTDSLVRHGENGFVVPVGDVLAFSQALDKLLSDSKLREQMGYRSRQMVKEFTLDRMLEETLAVYREVLGR